MRRSDRACCATRSCHQERRATQDERDVAHGQVQGQMRGVWHAQSLAQTEVIELRTEARRLALARHMHLLGARRRTDRVGYGRDRRDRLAGFEGRLLLAVGEGGAQLVKLLD